MRRTSTPKQRAALKRGSDIRTLRGCISLCMNVNRNYPNHKLKQAYELLNQAHNEIFGACKCIGCGKDLAHVNKSVCEDTSTVCWDLYSQNITKRR